ncbi:MAG: hypothetical protein HC848_02170 [Limnobacter sp.]|nr:hypothetical protein [Limnobacter sp.]
MLDVLANQITWPALKTLLEQHSKDPARVVSHMLGRVGSQALEDMDSASRERLHAYTRATIQAVTHQLGVLLKAIPVPPLHVPLANSQSEEAYAPNTAPVTTTKSNDQAGPSLAPRRSKRDRSAFGNEADGTPAKTPRTTDAATEKTF